MSPARLSAAATALVTAALVACGNSVVVDAGDGASTTSPTGVGGGGATSTTITTTTTTTTTSSTTITTSTTSTTTTGAGGAGAAGGAGGAGNAGGAGAAAPTYGAVQLYTDVERYVVYEDDVANDLCLFIQLAGFGGGAPGGAVKVLPEGFVAEHVGALPGVGSCRACYPGADAVTASDAKGLVVIDPTLPGNTIECDVAMAFAGAPAWVPAAANLITAPVPIGDCGAP
jgi:hypothetical protein